MIQQQLHQMPETELDAKTKQFMQSDLSEQKTSDDDVPVNSEIDSNQAVQDNESLGTEQAEVETPTQIEEQFDNRVYRAEAAETMVGYIDKVDITSLNEQPITITSMQINRGNCSITSMYDYKNMRYGSASLVYPRSKAEYIREVSISTANGTYTYRIG
ncbi:MAG: hypothetical protein GAK29_01153 [Acinetobacter bereziniae]|uniref:Uncharacterized protein n=1 Tax=Acinetobacter bereziniae TaxID=106648 RepID=A0A833UE41_ACIBZ|nr:MAG: hypothetical protein GAK29_01153 [Acinetobacter bereziniae]